MPVTKSAQKKLRKDLKREERNKKFEDLLKKTIKKVNKNFSTKNLQEASKVIDKAVKKNIIHENKGSRLKSKLSKIKTTKAAPVSSGSSKKASKK